MARCHEAELLGCCLDPDGCVAVLHACCYCYCFFCCCRLFLSLGSTHLFEFVTTATILLLPSKYSPICCSGNSFLVSFSMCCWCWEKHGITEASFWRHSCSICTRIKPKPTIQAVSKAVDGLSTSVDKLNLANDSSFVDKEVEDEAPAPPATPAFDCTCGMPLCICTAPTPEVPFQFFLVMMYWTSTELNCGHKKTLNADPESPESCLYCVLYHFCKGYV